MTTVLGRCYMIPRAMSSLLGAVILAPLCNSSLIAADGSWSNSTTSAGNWSDTTKWAGGILANGAGAIGNFNLDYGTNNKVITIDTTSRTLGTLNIGDPGFTYRSVTVQASGGASLVFNNNGSGALLSRTVAQTGGSPVIDLISAPMTLADNLVVNVTDTTANSGLRLNGVISESGGARSIAKNGSGLLQLGDPGVGTAPTNTFSGGFTLNAGEVQIVGSSVFGTGTLTINGGTLTARGGARTPANSVVVGGDFTLNGAGGGGNTLTLAGPMDLGGATRTITVSATTGAGVISGVISNGGLVKAGSRPLTLSAANTYTGSTTVNAGTLALSATGSIANSSAVVLNSGNFNVSAVVGGYVLGGSQTLSGSGSVTGDLTINGTLAIGNSPGTITFNDDLTLGNGSVSNFEFTVGTFSANSYDLALGGAGSQTVSFDGTLNLFFDSGETHLNNSSVKIFDFESYVGSFTSVTYTGLGAGQSAAFDSATGIVTVIPEPGAAALGGLGFLMLLRRRRQTT